MLDQAPMTVHVAFVTLSNVVNVIVATPADSLTLLMVEEEVEDMPVVQHALLGVSAMLINVVNAHMATIAVILMMPLLVVDPHPTVLDHVEFAMLSNAMSVPVETPADSHMKLNRSLWSNRVVSI
jgi:uncharacterized membrane protein YvlD (DUF360 family)